MIQLEHSAPEGSNAHGKRDGGMLAVILDDDSTLAATIGDLIMQEMPWEVLAFTDPRPALELIRRRLPDLVVLDVLMPTLDGLQVYDYLKADDATGSIPVLFISGMLGSEMSPLGIPNKIAFLSKPFDADEFISEIKVLLGI